MLKSLLLSHPAKFKSGRRFAQIFADKSKKSAFICVLKELCPPATRGWLSSNDFYCIFSISREIQRTLRKNKKLGALRVSVVKTAPE